MDVKTRELRDAHDVLAELYVEKLVDLLDRMPIEQAVLGLFCQLVRGGGNGLDVADVGCGTGRLAPYLSSQGLTPHGVDLSPEMIRVARRDYPDHPFQLADLRALPFADGSLAGAVGWYSLMYLAPEERPRAFEELARVVTSGGCLAAAFKTGDDQRRRAGRTLGLLFADPSLRTRVSMDQAAYRLGGRALPLEVGAGSWKLEVRDGVRMDGDCPEHVREAAPVLSQYVDAIGLRAFSRTGSLTEEDADATIQAFKRHASVPVFNLESAREHPCQGLADLLTARERFGETSGLRIALSWAPHRKPLPRAVPNSLLLTAAALGCEVTVAAPPDYALGQTVCAQAEALAAQSGGKVRYTQSHAEALAGAQILYAKAWGSTLGESCVAPNDPSLVHWMPRLSHFDRADPDAVFMHCLPVRRDLEIAAEVLDSERSLVVQQAANRVWVQMGVLAWIFGFEGAK